MHAHKSSVTILEDHRVEVRLPDDFPEGPAEVIVLASHSARTARPRRGARLPAEQETLAALAELRSVQLTPEEQEVLGGFETFQNEHPIRFASLTVED
ncbi:MAG TPA: hypothetical protein DD490_29270 [Acidobacteria bacterium]|nr:hypothetical protein [Acidobacteriota bacterium]